MNGRIRSLTRGSAAALALLLALCAARPLQAEITLNLRKDRVTLTDGTVVECSIVMLSERAVVIVEADPADAEKSRQRVIPRRVVKAIERGENEGRVVSLPLGDELARKVIGGSADAGEDGTEPEAAPAPKRTAKASPAAAKNKSAAEPLAPKGPAAGEVQLAGKTQRIAVEAVEVNKAAFKATPKDVADAYLGRFPALKDAAQSFLGAERVPALIDQAQKGDPLARAQTESFLRLFVGQDTSTLGAALGAPGTSAPKPSKPTKLPKKPRPAGAPAQ